MEMELSGNRGGSKLNVGDVTVAMDVPVARRAGALPGAGNTVGEAVLQPLGAS